MRGKNQEVLVLDIFQAGMLPNSIIYRQLLERESASQHAYKNMSEEAEKVLGKYYKNNN